MVKAPSAIVTGISRLRDVASAKKLGGERIDREHDDGQRNSAIGQKRRDENDRQHGTVSAENRNGAGNDGARKSGKLDQLAEASTQQKDGELELHEAGHPLHEEAGENPGDGGRIGQ